MLYGKTKIGNNPVIQENVIIGLPPRDLLKERNEDLPGATIGNDCVIRSGTVIYSRTKIGNKFQTGHNVLIREDTEIGSDVLIGTNSIVENKCVLGNNISIQSNVYIPANTTIEDNVFIGPNACLTNDKYPVRMKKELKGPIIRSGASIGANSTILPGIEIGKGSIVAAGAVVTKNVAPWKIVLGNPAREVDMPEKLRVKNKIGEQ
jgi:acetyltransferase-like isoleucine patch superfamily enzyme